MLAGFLGLQYARGREAVIGIVVVDILFKAGVVGAPLDSCAQVQKGSCRQRLLRVDRLVAIAATPLRLSKAKN